jgi:hypothetical protein
MSELATDVTSCRPGRPPERQLRVRVVVHAGTMFYDANGCFGETLDVAFRLLDAPQRQGRAASREPGRASCPVSVQVAGNEHEGRVSLLPG